MEKDEIVAKLTITKGEEVGKSFSLEKNNKKIIGRGNNCQIQIFDKGISRNHSFVEWDGKNFLLIDLGSTNGTLVNNKLAISKPLQEGDSIKVGHTELKFQKITPKKKTHTSLVIDQLLTKSPNTIMERLNIKESFCASVQNLKALQDEEGNEAKDNIADIYLSTIYEISNLVNAEKDLQKLFNVIMDKVMETFEADRAFLVMQDGDEFDITVERTSSPGENKLSYTILKKTINEGVSVLSANAMLDDRFNTGMSIIAQQIQAVMCVPLESSNKILGAIYVDSIGSSNCFKKTHLDLLATIGKQAGIAIERNMLFQESLENEKIKQSLEIAQDIQQSLLSSNIPPNCPYDLVGWNITCDETGGDYYDYFELPNHKLGLAIGDVSGHGIGAALLMATARAFLRALTLKSKKIKSTMNTLNTLLEQDMDDDKFMTMFYGELNIRKGLLHYVNAGHDAPLLYHKSGKKFISLGSTGMPLGMMDDFEYEEDKEIKICQGDILVLTTDGITESMNPKDEQFGTERLKKVIAKNANLSANQIIKACNDSLTKFCKGRPQRDDITMVIMKFEPRKDKK